MAKPNQLNQTMRTYHRYLGFFLAGIMAVYSISGIIMVFRNTDFLKSVVKIEKTVEPNLKGDQLGPILKMKVNVEKEENGIIYFKGGQYNSQTGEIKAEKKELPFILGKMEHLHKATTNDPLFYLNLFFGLSLFFFVVSSFWMFLPGTKIFKKGLYFTLGGIILTIIMLFV
ncbi:hypothetical protein [Lacihabitans soyangensis]|uniref:PepSY domain-containing protein n=1 Tax=Lacihabitans soyangensis TaxID=869394 RepID=A0AAE3H6L2_9BACT|nr:hypothetical protein [Lacihabitans soyangensis]MCP9763950.1 hypothetical protein [Lacihabitans soyangensis]